MVVMSYWPLIHRSFNSKLRERQYVNPEVSVSNLEPLTSSDSFESLPMLVTYNRTLNTRDFSGSELNGAHDPGFVVFHLALPYNLLLMALLNLLTEALTARVVPMLVSIWEIKATEMAA